LLRSEKNSHYMSYNGTIYRRSLWSMTLFKADGRIMIDGSSFRRMNPNYKHPDFVGSSVSTNQNALESVSEKNYYKTWPTLLGFSFASKKWGEISVERCRPIAFDDGAFERLVLREEFKDMIKALVTNQDRSFTDIITGKGGGCIFLLHGSPGVGKTLTAEAIAELLHKPLYSVTVGELGTDTVQLEESLREILEVASTWNAVILLDEADIFLEKRTENDIKRNAMVGIFLRLLEYHQGVLFLTTNRVKTFDRAFHSRISVALKYEDLDIVAREKIWKNFLDLSNINLDEKDVKKLAKFELNGRQIKNVVRLTRSLSMSKDVPITLDQFESVIHIIENFKTDIIENKENGNVF